MNRHSLIAMGLVLLITTIIGCKNGDDPTGPVNPPTATDEIFFVSSRDGNAEIYSMKPDGSSLQRLTDNSSTEHCVKVNVAGTKVGFVSDRSGNSQVWTMNVDGSGQTQVTTSGTLAGQYGTYGGMFDWTPDGKILYTHGMELYRIDADGTRNTLIWTCQAGRNLAYLSCCRLSGKIAVMTMGTWAYDTEIIVMNADGTGATEIVPNAPGGMSLNAFSRDGQRLLFTHDISGHEEASGLQLDSHVFSIGIDGKNKQDLSGQKPVNTNDYGGAWTSAGTSLYFFNYANVWGGEATIYRMNADGSGRVAIMNNGDSPTCK